MVFWHHSVSVNEPAPFQLAVFAPQESLLARFTFASLRIQFGQMAPITIVHAENSDSRSVQRVDLGDLSMQEGRDPRTAPLIADLKWAAGATKVFCGSISSFVTGELKVCSCPLICLCLIVTHLAIGKHDDLGPQRRDLDRGASRRLNIRPLIAGRSTTASQKMVHIF